MPRFSFATLRARLLWLILLAIIPALVLIFYTNLELRQMAAGDAKKEALRLVRLVANDQADTIRDTRQFLFALAQLPQVSQASPAECSDIFAQLLRQYPQYTLLGVSAPDGDIFCSAYPIGMPINLADQPFFQQILQTRDFAISDYQIGLISGKATLNFGYPVLADTGDVTSVIFGSLDLTWLNELAAEAQLPEGSTFTVIDRNGTVLVRYPDPDIWIGRSIPEAPIVELILTEPGEGTVEAAGVDGRPRLFAFTPLYGTATGGDVYVTIGIPTTVALAETNRFLLRNLVGLGLVTLLALAAAWFGGYWFILRWVQRLVETTKRLRDGDLQTRTGLPYDQTELSQLAQAFDEMAAALQQHIDERDQAEKTLRETQRILATLLSNLPGMAYRCHIDRLRTMEFVSDGCHELTGYNSTEITGNDLVAYGRLIHQDDQEAVWQEIQTAVQENRSFQLTYRLLTRTGHEKWVWEQGRGVFSTAGELLALEGFITDATERMAAYHTLEQRVADRTRELETLYEVTAVASESLDLTATLDRSLERVLAALDARLGMIHLFDETKQALQLAAQRSEQSIELKPGDPQLPDDSLVEWVFEHQRSLVVPNLETEPRASLEVVAVDKYACVGVPMRASGRVLGVLTLIGPSGHQYTAEAVALLNSIADQVGVAVENAQLYTAEHIRRHQADTLLRVASVVGSTLDLEEVLARILDQLRRVVEYDSASVQLLENEKLQVIAARGFADVGAVLGATFLLDEPPHSLVLSKGKSLNLVDAPALYPRFRQPPFTHIRSWLGVPLRVQERIIGLIAVDRQHVGGYDDEEVRLTTAFADQAALALENARLYRQAEQLAVMEERSRLARELHDSVTQSLYSLTLFAEAGRRAVEGNDIDQAIDYLSRLGQVAQQALREMRLLVFELRLPALETEGLVRALQHRLDAVEKRAGVEARLLVQGMVELPPSVEEGLYRIAQEALNNSLKHAAATLVTVRVNAGDDLVELEIADNGLAFDPVSLQNRGGMGLKNMRERTDRLGGSFTLVSKPETGTKIRVFVPTRRSWSRPLLPIDRMSEVS